MRRKEEEDLFVEVAEKEAVAIAGDTIADRR